MQQAVHRQHAGGGKLHPGVGALYGEHAGLEQLLHAEAQALGMAEVVAVLEEHIAPFRQGQGEVFGVVGAEIGVEAADAEAAIALGQALQQLPGAIGTGIVDKNNLSILPTLREQRCYRLLNVIFYIMCCYEHACKMLGFPEQVRHSAYSSIDNIFKHLNSEAKCWFLASCDLSLELLYRALISGCQSRMSSCGFLVKTQC